MGWTTFTTDTVSRDSLAAAYDSSANLTYAIDGVNSGSLATVTAFSHGSNAWTAETNDSAGVRTEIGAAYDSTANLTYAIDGFNTDVASAYAQGSNSWTSIHADTAVSSTGRGYFGCAYDSSANLTYAIDGLGLHSTDMSTVTAYSQGSNTWTTEASDAVKDLNTAVYDSAANVTYSLGGENSSFAAAGSTAYSEGSNTWSGIQMISAAAHGSGYDVAGNLTLLVSNSFSTGTFAYAHGSNTWTNESSNDPTARSAVGGAYDTASNFLYIIDGLNAGATDTNVMHGFHLPVVHLQSLSANLTQTGNIPARKTIGKLVAGLSMQGFLVTAKNGVFNVTLAAAGLSMHGSQVPQPQKTLTAALHVAGSLVARAYQMTVGFIPIKRYP